MTVNLLSGIVRIESNKRIGTGFVASDDGLILTCAHVLGRSMPQEVRVVFQRTGEEREAVVLAEGWRGVDAEDVALLSVSGGLPAGVQSLPLGSSVGTEGHSLVTFGYPEQGEVEGARGTGKIVGPGARTRAGQPLLQLHSSQITEGFSGAPIWDELRQRVIGMVVIAAESDALGRGGETSFATPTETLQAIVPALRVSDICPYRSLEVFSEEDASFFFGRQPIVDELIASLRKESRFLAVFGSSGCGKSSLVRAGLIPRLREGGVPGSDSWMITVTRPTDLNFEQLLKDLHQLSPRTAVIVDQFEELFVSSSEAVRGRIVTELTRILEHLPQITLVLVMRNDFYNRFVQQETLEPWLTRGLVNVPSTVGSSELASIAETPASLVGIRFEDGLIEIILRDALSTTFRESQVAGSSTVLPLLEFALTQLWDLRQDGMLTRQAYEKIGGVTGALEEWANKAYYDFEEVQRPLVRRLFMDLVYLGDKEEHIPDTRRRRELYSLVHAQVEQAEVYQIVEDLADARLMVVSRDTETKKETVEIIHDALLREWGELQQWVEDDRNFLLWHQELERRVRAWKETNRANSAKRDRSKLLRDTDLTEAMKWLKTHDSRLHPDELSLIQNSRTISRRRVLVLAGGGLLGVAALSTGGIFLSLALQSPARTQYIPLVPPRSLPYSYKGHSSYVTTVAWSPDGTRLASASWDMTVQVWEASSGKTLLTYQGHTDMVHSFTWSPNGRRIASASSDKTVQVWEASSGKTLLTYQGHTHGVGSVAWSPNGRRIASASSDKTVQVWDASSGKTLLTYRGHTKSVSSVAWSPDSTHLASASSDKTVQVWEADSGTLVFPSYRGHKDAVWSVAWSPHGKRLASAGGNPTSGFGDTSVQVWDGGTGALLFTYRGHREFVNQVVWSPDGRWLASASDDTTVQVWDANSGTHLYTYRGHTLYVWSVAWSPDGTRLASASTDLTVQVWKFSTGLLLFPAYRGHNNVVWSAAWSPDGRRLASTSSDKTVQVWDASTGANPYTYQGHTDVVWSAAWSPDGRRIASASRDKTVQVWDASTGKTLLTDRSNSAVYSVAWSPDGRYLASTGADKTVRIWDVSTGKTLLTYRGHKKAVQSVAWSPDSRRLASASGNRDSSDGETSVQVWDTSTGTLLYTYPGHMGAVNSVEWSPDGRRLASASADTTVQVWDATTGTHLYTYQGYSEVMSVTWSPDGRHLASASATTVQIWDVSTGIQLYTYQNHTNKVNSVAWSPDTYHIASASWDTTVQVWLVLPS